VAIKLGADSVGREELGFLFKLLICPQAGATATKVKTANAETNLFMEKSPTEMRLRCRIGFQPVVTDEKSVLLLNLKFDPLQGKEMLSNAPYQGFGF
jgi:hypothetical protein